MAADRNTDRYKGVIIIEIYSTVAIETITIGRVIEWIYPIWAGWLLTKIFSHH